MTQVIEIEGELVTFVEKNVTRQVTLAELLPHLENRVVVEVPSLPRSAVFVRYDESNPPLKKAYFLCEIAPGIKNIIKNGRRYRLAMPWTYLWFECTSDGSNSVWSIEDYRAFHAKEQYRDMNSPMVKAFNPNLYEDGRICFGSTGAPITLPLGERIDHLVNNWYLTEFNNDLEDYFHLPHNYDSFRDWVEASRENANCWMGWANWSSPDWTITVKELVDDHTTRPLVATVAGQIRPIQVPYTFGRAEEYLRTLSPEMRGRLLVALENIAADNSADVVRPEMPTAFNFDADDDGGEPI